MDDDQRLTPWPQTGLYPTADRASIIKEVESGLRNERDRLKDAAENQSYFDLDGEAWVTRREAETEFDWAGRPKRVSGFLHQAVSRLCQHTYNPGPMRTLDGGGPADELLQAVYETNHIDMLMHAAETLATVNDVAAIEVKPTNNPDKPIDLQLWGGEEFTVFVDPEDQRNASAVVTIDRYDQQTRYRLWFADELLVFLTDKAEAGATAGGVEAKFDHSEPNTCGVLPFAFVSHHARIRQFWTPGPGTFLREAEGDINDRLSGLAESGNKYINPIGIFKNVGAEFNPQVGPGGFLRLLRSSTGYGGEGYESGGEVGAEYLQAAIQIEGWWADLKEYIAQVAECVGLPASALRLEYQTDAASGIALVIKQSPLIARARQRRPIFQRAEAELKEVILTCYGNHYGKPAITAVAIKSKLLTAWPEPCIPIPGQERDDADAWELGLGITSRVQIVQKRFGLTRDQALAHLKQVAQDNTEAEAVSPLAEQDPGMMKAAATAALEEETSDDEATKRGSNTAK